MTSIQEVYQLFLKSSGVQTDSRKVTSNQLFFALNGPNFNANTFAHQAIEKGALAAIVDNKAVADANQACYLVDNVLKTLQELAQLHRNQFDIPVLALTGSNGKTTTKALIQAVLSANHTVLATEGNLNNHIGVPLTLLRLTAAHSHAIIEMGANHLKEIAFLCEIAQPTYGLITNVGKAHLEGFGSEEGVFQGKTELYDFIEKKDGLIFVNEDDHKLFFAIGNVAHIAFEPSEYSIVQEQPTLKLVRQNIEIPTQLVGTYNKENIVAAISIGAFFDVSSAKAAKAISEYSPNNSRSQLLKQNGKTLTFDAYNANPSSMKAAITAFSKRSGKKAVILGHMAELGTYESAEHQALVDLVTNNDFDTCYWVGKPYEPIVATNYFASVEELNVFLRTNPIEADQVLIKGSRSATLEKVLESL
ncbi:UDP-N-acetylmuramoyl-tripeptide--D-alanyl-D-alanine ligase [Flavobacteriaceae bacterium]|jgi:UDP-N-acetylmuramoyl-tripeptide--D-alanyl-D-alanine ligase|nr:UDP-N-acetylmuramoyl-tripeptide--D-alanyl-D-alanine ligase [Flavobacteriaceae bacterium]MDG1722572.1 UDP-N-acetylmuramoyl-tripeptide--D-alanyl-D-alanine ligase [Flavobacteriaceae bacterium]MDG2290731.1 UDP-N-acetylmuramoyl-tripeptide--D-alanyl-D-alanine ligase [Flavobacteriaceae bacterium]